MIDLRSEGEKAAQGPPLALRTLPICVDQGNVAQMLGSSPGRAQYARIYVGIVEKCSAAVAAAYRAVAGASGAGGTVLGCSIGKDRTGVMVGLILASLGIPDADILAAEDAARTVMAGVIRTYGTSIGPLAPAHVVARLQLGSEPVGDCLDHCRTVYGSIDGYLAHIGIGADVIQAMRAGLLLP